MDYPKWATGVAYSMLKVKAIQVESPNSGSCMASAMSIDPDNQMHDDQSKIVSRHSAKVECTLLGEATHAILTFASLSIGASTLRIKFFTRREDPV